MHNVTDRLVHKASAETLTPAIDALLSTSSYAYRKGLNRAGAASALKKAMSAGFTSAVKADIAAFFDSVDLERLDAILCGYFPFEPLIGKIVKWVRASSGDGTSGLPQGSPLSPLLSNLYLDRFDKEMEKTGLKLIRYSDDFVVLNKDEECEGDRLKKIGESDQRLGV